MSYLEIMEIHRLRIVGIWYSLMYRVDISVFVHERGATLEKLPFELPPNTLLCITNNEFTTPLLQRQWVKYKQPNENRLHGLLVHPVYGIPAHQLTRPVSVYRSCCNEHYRPRRTSQRDKSFWFKHLYYFLFHVKLQPFKTFLPIAIMTLKYFISLRWIHTKSNQYSGMIFLGDIDNYLQRESMLRTMSLYPFDIKLNVLQWVTVFSLRVLTQLPADGKYYHTQSRPFPHYIPIWEIACGLQRLASCVSRRPLILVWLSYPESSWYLRLDPLCWRQLAWLPLPAWRLCFPSGSPVWAS